MAVSLKKVISTGMSTHYSRLLCPPLAQFAYSGTPPTFAQFRSFPTSRTTWSQARYSSSKATAQSLHEKATADEMEEYNSEIEHYKQRQQERPWHREGVDSPPVRRQRSAGAMTKGKLLTTPSRLLKLVLPLTTVDHNTDRKDVAPLALLVHPQQPLSYLERLIQAELPPMEPDESTEDNTKKSGPNSSIRSVTFRAMESKDDEIKPKKKSESEGQAEKGAGDSVESYSGAGREGKGKDEGEFIRWSASTEIGDFIRDAARAKEFEVEIEGSPEAIKVAVPSFNDRTFYLRQRLRRTSRKISDLATIKSECDKAAHRGAQRIAMSGCAGLIGYWYLVYRLTFETDLGWDVMEPVSHLPLLTRTSFHLHKD